MRRIKAFPRAWRIANGGWSAAWFAFATFYLVVDNDALFIGGLILGELAVLEHRYLKPRTRLWVNGQELGPSRTVRVDIRSKGDDA